MDEISIRESLRGKNILLTGASGFLGKVWLCLTLAKISEIGKVYVLMRSKGPVTALQRMEKIINTSPAFSILHETHGDQLQSFLKKHLQVIDGDVCQANFGMSGAEVRRLEGRVDLILNCAGIVDFSPDLRDAFSANVQGPLHAAQLARSLGIPLLHISTAYVCGNRDGIVREEFIPDYCPSGEAFDPIQEYDAIASLVGAKSDRSGIELGKERAKRWGWPNAYTLTKSLAESLLAKQADKIKMSFFRPAIVESSLNFPFPGWNEGITTCAPLSYLASNWIRVLPMKPRYVFDIIPVDLVCQAMTLATAALLKGKAHRVYHCGSSDLNPLSQKFAIELMNQNHREYFNAKGKGFFEKLYLSRSHPVIVDEKSLFTAQNFKKLTSIAIELADLVGPHLPDYAQGAIASGKKTLKKAKYEFLKAEHILDTYRPFLNYDYLFKTGNLKSHRVKEAEFQFNPEKISWSEYIVQVHEPGLRKWCYPLIEGKTPEEYQATHPCSLSLCEFNDTEDKPGPQYRELKLASKH